jgi:hypothetical protein
LNLASIQQLVLIWVGLYTRNLSQERRLERLDEIESDMWEHVADGRAQSRSEGALAVEMLARLVRGMPADVFWRLQAADPAPQTRPVLLREVLTRIRLVAKVGVFGLARFFGYYLGALLLIVSLADFVETGNHPLMDWDLVLASLFLGGALMLRVSLCGTFLMVLGALGNAVARPEGMEVWLVFLPIFLVPVILTLRMPPHYWRL